MKLTKETINVLKNFSGINSNLLIKPGKKLGTITPAKSVLASVTVAEDFPVEFGIYDLSQFLGVLSLFEDPEINFTDKEATIKEGKRSIKYTSAEKAVLKVPPDKEIKYPGSDVDFNLDSANLAQIIKTASVLAVPNLQFVGDGSKIIGIVTDIKVSNGNSYEIEIGDTDKTFTADFKIENLKMIIQDYKIELSAKRLSRWTAVKDSDMTLFVALESTSKFD
jgi:hypothetical protein